MLELFITGTEHNSGKTFITAGLAATMQSLGYSTSVYKPVQTGAIEKNGFLQAPDLAYIKYVDPYIKTYFSYLLKNRLIPAVAAPDENVCIDRDTLVGDYQSIANRYECIITDGTDGIATPLNKGFTEENLVKALNLPLLLVVSPAISSINNVIMTINYAKAKEIELRGVILNDCPELTYDMDIKAFPRLIEEYTDANILGIVPHIDDLKTINPNDLITNILTGIDIESVFDVKIAKLEM